MLTIAPVTSKILQVLGYHQFIEAAATDTQVICAAEERSIRPALYPEGELEKVTGVHEFSSGFSDEMHLVTRDRATHMETLAWQIKDAVIASGRICTHRHFTMLTYQRRLPLPRLIDSVDTSMALCSTKEGNDYFAHFLLDDCSTALMAHEYGKPFLANAGGSLRTAHMHDYLTAFNLNLTDEVAIHVPELWLFRDFPQNSHRRSRLNALRDQLDSRYGTDTTSPAYIRRGSTGAVRVLQNEQLIEDRLQKQGFQIIDPSELTVQEICNRINGSPLVVGVEGSHLAHGVLNLAPEGTLLCIQPATRFNAVYRDFSNSLDLNWGFVVAEGDVDGFTVDPDRLQAMIDRVLGTDQACR